MLVSKFHSNLLRVFLRVPQTSIFGMIQCKSTNIDVFDVFTTEILSNKSLKLPLQSSTDIIRPLNIIKPTECQTGIKLKTITNNDTVDWSESEIDQNLIVSMDCGDRKTFDGIIEQMLTLKRLPSEKIIVRVLCYLCDDNVNSMNTIIRLIDLCQEINLGFYAKNVDFAPFLSQYLWKLQKFDEALNTLNAIFGVTNKTSKSLILRNYRQIIYDAVKNQDESVVDKVISNALEINERHKDSILIVYVWSDCFFSELFRNQQKAETLFAAHDVIRTTISKDVGWIALTLLQQVIHNLFLQKIEKLKNLIKILLLFPAQR